MRAILALAGIILLVVVILIATGMLNLNISGGRLPSVSAETGSVHVGESNDTVRVPTVEMKDKKVALPKVEVRPAASPTPAQ